MEPPSQTRIQSPIFGWRSRRARAARAPGKDWCPAPLGPERRHDAPDPPGLVDEAVELEELDRVDHRLLADAGEPGQPHERGTHLALISEGKSQQGLLGLPSFLPPRTDTTTGIPANRSGVGQDRMLWTEGRPSSALRSGQAQRGWRLCGRHLPRSHPGAHGSA
jgi:hypothetical protein